jgi:hypothetical protein
VIDIDKPMKGINGDVSCHGNRETGLTFSNNQQAKDDPYAVHTIRNIPNKDDPQSRFFWVRDCATPLQEQAPEAWQPAWIGSSGKL